MTNYHPKPWTLPRNYSGGSWPEWFVFLSQNRDSDALERSNFTCALAAVQRASSTVGGHEDDQEIAPQPVRENHFAVGWVEWIAIHSADAGALAEAERLADKLDGYPVVNEDHLSTLEHNEAMEYWDAAPLHERMAFCLAVGVSIFAARRSPEGRVYDYVQRCSQSR